MVLSCTEAEFMKWNGASAHLCMKGLNGLERKNPDQMFNSREKFLANTSFMMGNGSVWTWDFHTGVSSLHSSITSGLLRTMFWEIVEFALKYDLKRNWNCHLWQVLLMPHKCFSFFGPRVFREGKVRMNTIKSIWTLPIIKDYRLMLTNSSLELFQKCYSRSKQ